MRATSTSMPPPTQFPDAQGNSVFFGDYSGSRADPAHIRCGWTPGPLTRSCAREPAAPGVPPALCTGTEPNGLLANDQTIYTGSLPAS